VHPRARAQPANRRARPLANKESNCAPAAKENVAARAITAMDVVAGAAKQSHAADSGIISRAALVIAPWQHPANDSHAATRACAIADLIVNARTNAQRVINLQKIFPAFAVKLAR
jgi:hypothetical protein